MAKNNTYVVTSDRTGAYLPFPAATASKGRTYTPDVRTVPVQTTNTGLNTQSAIKNAVAGAGMGANGSVANAARGVLVGGTTGANPGINGGVNNVLANNANAALAGALMAYNGAGYSATTPGDGGNGGGGGDLGSSGGSSGGGLSTSSNPYADIFALYQEQLNANRDALAQQNQARINALQTNYANARNQLDSSFASGEAALNQNADESLRQAWVNNKLNQKAMAQYLASQGIVGGAAESIIANLYNTYGNNRNSIEKGRANDLRDLLTNYQGSLGNIENAYANGLADANGDYITAIMNAMNDYYSGLRSFQQQNINNQYKSALGKSGSSSSDNNLNSTIMNGVKNHKGNLSAAKAYLTFMGVPEAEQDLYLWNSGFDMTPAAQAQAQAEAYSDALGSIDSNLRNTIVNDLKRVYPTSAKDGLSANQSLYANVINLLNKYARQYGLTDAQAQALLREAGF